MSKSTNMATGPVNSCEKGGRLGFVRSTSVVTGRDKLPAGNRHSA
jgi:hypothetical protein